MNINFIELEKALSSEAQNKTDNTKRHLSALSREANAICKAQKRFAKKLDEFVKDELLPNDVKCRIFETVREHIGIPKRKAKILLEKFRFSERLEKFLPENEKLTAKEFFELDCLMANPSKQSKEEALTDEELKNFLYSVANIKNQ